MTSIIETVSQVLEATGKRVKNRSTQEIDADVEDVVCAEILPERPAVSEFQIGDLVLIVSHGDPSTTCWILDMDRNVGQSGKVVWVPEAEAGGDVVVAIEGSGPDYWYPAETLVRIPKK